MGYIQKARDAGAEILVGGTGAHPVLANVLVRKTLL
jgi:hypothetical protein